jgi:hypothetical protein
MKMKNLEQREGYINRHTDGLPKEKCAIKIVKNDIDREHVFICAWEPFIKPHYSNELMPDEGYLGTASVIYDRYKGLGFHAWKQNDSEFIWYTVIYP